MQVTFQLNPRDSMANPRLSIYKFWLLIAATLAPLAFINWVLTASINRVLAAWLALVWIASEIAMHLASLRAYKSILHKYPVLLEPMTIRLGDDGISTRVSHSLLWSCVERIVETKKHFFVIVKPTFQGDITIPKRAFDSPAQCAEFGALLKRKWAEHHSDAAPIASPQ